MSSSTFSFNFRTAQSPFLSEENSNIVDEIEQGLNAQFPTRELFDGAVAIAKSMLAEPFRQFFKSSHYRAFISATVPKDAAIRYIILIITFLFQSCKIVST